MTDIISWIGPLALAAVTWIFKQVSDLKTRIAVLETNHGNLDKKLDSIESKLDRLIEKEGA